MGIACRLLFLPVGVVLAADQSGEPWASLPWYLLVGIGLLTIFFSSFLFLVAVFSRGRRLDAGKNRVQETDHSKKKYPTENWPLQIEQPSNVDET